MSNDRVNKVDFTVDETVRIAKEIKDNLIDKWFEDGGFVDKNRMQTRSIMPESIGLLSLVLLTTAFNEAKGFQNNESKSKIEKIVKSSVDFIYNDVNKPHTKYPDRKKGFTAEPLYPASRTELLFSDENGYTDTVTYVLSTMILVRYNQTCGNIKIDEETTKKIFELIRETIGHIICGQCDNIVEKNGKIRYSGTWGYKTYRKRTDEHTEDNSLYFTYCCNCSITDLFNYIFGEIKEVEEINEGLLNDANSDNIDRELVNYLNEEYGDIYNIMNGIREKTSIWLLEQALPRLPRISDCINTDAHTKDVLGISVPDMQLDDPVYNGVNYLYLYPTYYLLDMLTNGYIDNRFHDMIDSIKNPGFMKILKDKYKDVMSDTDRLYFFREGSGADLYEEYYKGYLEQAIQSSRFRYLDASRTGIDFWSNYDPSIGSKSELELKWVAIDAEENRTIMEVTNKRWPREPALISMSVKSNICFSYYVSKERDFSIDKMFSNIIDDRSSITDDHHVKGLWDDISYNLQVTERSIEALIDYYDYQNKFPTGTVVVSASGTKSELDAAVERLVETKIAELMTGSAPAIVVNKPAVQDDAVPIGALDPESLVKTISECSDEQLCKIFDALVTAIMPDVQNLRDVTGFVSENGEEPLMVKLTRIAKKMQVQTILMRYCNTTGSRFTKSNNISDKLDSKYDALSEAILDDDQMTDWADLYNKLIQR